MTKLGRVFRRKKDVVRKPVEPERRPVELDNWQGLWVAVKDGQVIAAAPTSRELVPMIHAKGEAGRGAVAQFVPKPCNQIVVGLG